MNSAPRVPANIDSYISPLAESEPTLPEQHYNTGSTTPASVKYTKATQFSGYCEVCKLRLNSYTQSKSHFEGKPHSKKLKKKEEEEAAAEAARKEKEGSCTSSPDDDEPPRKKQHIASVSKLFCGACNLTFTSEAHAKDHYLGRNHDRVLHGLAPYFTGYYNTSTNKWQRTPPDPRVSAQLLSSEPPADMKGKAPHQDKPKIRGKYHCELCNCSSTCQEQLDAHLKGSRHAKNLKKSAADTSEASSEGKQPESAAGFLKCDLCNVIVNSSSQYEAHISSKKHKAKFAQTGKSVEENNEEEPLSSPKDMSSGQPPSDASSMLSCDYDPFDPTCEDNE